MVITTKSAIHLVLLAIFGGVGSWAANAAGNPDFQVAIRLLGSDKVSAPDLRGAKDVASAILASASVHVRWQDGDTIQAAADTIDVRFVHSKLLSTNPRSVAEANGDRITVFLDRVSDYANRNPLYMPRILGHVLAHEIGHVLQGTGRHSRSGVMKAHWDEDDYITMRTKNLGFIREDAAAIESHLTQNRARTRIGVPTAVFR
jgi:hypothetical protein